MALTPGTATATKEENTATSISNTHTVVSGGDVGIARIAWNNHATDGPLDVTAVTWDGNSMTFMGEEKNVDDGAIEIWRIEGANVGSGSVTVTATFDRAGGATVTRFLVAQSYSGGDTPDGFSSNSVQGDTSGTISTTVTSATGNLVASACVLEGTSPDPDLNGTQEYDGTAGADGIASEFDRHTGATSVTCTATWVESDVHSAIAGVNIPAAAGTTRSPGKLDLALDMKTPAVSVPSRKRQTAFRWRNSGPIGAPP